LSTRAPTDPAGASTLGTAIAEGEPASSERLAAVGKLAARVAHELNNPLDGILRYLNLATRVMNTDTASAGRYVEEARKGITRMVHIVRQLLEFSRNARDGDETGNVNKLLDEAIQSFAESARERGVTVICNYDDPPAPVQATNLFHVFCNLIKNALDAMPSGGTLTVSSRSDETAVRVTFEDDGAGIPPNVIDHIFEPFFTTKPSGEGTGLGLAICREVIDRAGGTITAENVRPHGACFRISIPVKRTAAGEGARPRAERKTDD
jgi:signal transduction histidine kinase